jgi:chloramphenicol O-acetyltransferase
MQVTINEIEAKELFKEVVLELLQEKRSEFYELVIEAMEEIGLANAIREGRQNDFVSEEEIRAILVG